MAPNLPSDIASPLWVDGGWGRITFVNRSGNRVADDRTDRRGDGV